MGCPYRWGIHKVGFYCIVTCQRGGVPIKPPNKGPQLPKALIPTLCYTCIKVDRIKKNLIHIYPNGNPCLLACNCIWIMDNGPDMTLFIDTLKKKTKKNRQPTRVGISVSNDIQYRPISAHIGKTLCQPASQFQGKGSALKGLRSTYTDFFTHEYVCEKCYIWSSVIMGNMIDECTVGSGTAYYQHIRRQLQCKCYLLLIPNDIANDFNHC